MYVGSRDLESRVQPAQVESGSGLLFLQPQLGWNEGSTMDANKRDQIKDEV